MVHCCPAFFFRTPLKQREFRYPQKTPVIRRIVEQVSPCPAKLKPQCAENLASFLPRFIRDDEQRIIRLHVAEFTNFIDFFRLQEFH